jgi:hypothetical protein
MPKPHSGALSGVAYTIPEHADVSDIEVAFAGFADTIPAAPAAIKTVTVTADVPTPDLNTLYVFDGSAAHTLSLVPGVHDGDKIQVLQLQNDPITIAANGVSVQGPLVTTGHFSAITLIWQANPGRWVGSPFSFSGVLPPESQGGDEIIDAGGFRYHIFRNSGAFYSHRDMLVNAYLVGAGGDGAPAGTAAGDGGSPGEYRFLQGQRVDAMQSYAIVVGKTPQADGEPSSFATEQARGGAAGVADQVGPVEAPTTLPAALAAVLGFTEVGGSGAKDVGPAAPTAYGKGGGGAHITKAQITRPSHVESGSTPGTPDRWIVTRPAWTETVLSHYETVTYRGDPCQGTYKDQCPGGWYCVQAGQPNNWCETQVSEPRYTTINHPEEGYWGGGSPGSSWSNTVWDPCPSGYKVGADTTKCEDSRGVGPGQGGDGLVVVAYAYP